MFYDKTFGGVIGKRWKVIFLAGLVFSFVALVISIILPLQYRADAQVLIISKSRYGVDPYTVVKSAERVGENLTQIMKSNDFYNKVVINPSPKINITIHETGKNKNIPKV